ncbi:unnamed protein product, partial [Didymodactylos carnosus]
HREISPKYRTITRVQQQRYPILRYQQPYIHRQLQAKHRQMYAMSSRRTVNIPVRQNIPLKRTVGRKQLQKRIHLVSKIPARKTIIKTTVGTKEETRLQLEELIQRAATNLSSVNTRVGPTVGIFHVSCLSSGGLGFKLSIVVLGILGTLIGMGIKSLLPDKKPGLSTKKPIVSSTLYDRQIIATYPV